MKLDKEQDAVVCLRRHPYKKDNNKNQELQHLMTDMSLPPKRPNREERREDIRKIGLSDMTKIPSR